MTNYIDGFVLPIPAGKLGKYRNVVDQVAEIWIEHGALRYAEYVIEDPDLDGTRSFVDVAGATGGDRVIFGWVSFESREARDRANELVRTDPRMAELTAPLTLEPGVIFDASRMVYGGFERLVEVSRVDG